jgi:hypothetical protein
LTKGANGATDEDIYLMDKDQLFEPDWLLPCKNKRYLKFQQNEKSGNLHQ